MVFDLHSVFHQIILNVKRGLLFTAGTEITKPKKTSSKFTSHSCHYKVTGFMHIAVGPNSQRSKVTTTHQHYPVLLLL